MHAASLRSPATSSREHGSSKTSSSLKGEVREVGEHHAARNQSRVDEASGRSAVRVQRKPKHRPHRTESPRRRVTVRGLNSTEVRSWCATPARGRTAGPRRPGSFPSHAPQVHRRRAGPGRSGPGRGDLGDGCATAVRRLHPGRVPHRADPSAWCFGAPFVRLRAACGHRPAGASSSTSRLELPASVGLSLPGHRALRATVGRQAGRRREAHPTGRVSPSHGFGTRPGAVHRDSRVT